MMRNGIIVLLLATAGFSSLFAQPSLTLSLDSAVNYAIAYNKTLMISGLSIDQADEKVKETIAQGLPQLDATLDYSNFLGAETTLRLGSMPDTVPPSIIKFNPTSNFQFTASQLVFSGSYIVGLQSVKLYKSLSKTNYEKTQEDITEQVMNSYYLVLISERNNAIVKKNLENLKDVFTNTQSLLEFGVREKTDVDQLRVQVSMMENQLRSSERTVEVNYNLLRLQLGVPAQTQIILTDSLDAILKRADFEATLMQDFKIEDNIQYQAMNVQEKISEKQVLLQKMNYLPTISGFYRYTNKLMKPEFDISPNSVLGLNMSIPIFSSGKRRAQVSQAKISLETTQTQKDLLAEQLRIQEKQSRYNLKNAIDQYNSQKENVDVAKSVYDSYREKYRQGLISSLDLTNVNNNYLQAQSAYISSLFQVLQAQTALEKLLSTL
ncbi:MAG TPA: TolC family protein [Bacteroidales bacterium]|nr:TolC family protein [Bacteroidales bacterium]